MYCCWSWEKKTYRDHNESRSILLLSRTNSQSWNLGILASFRKRRKKKKKKEKRNLKSLDRWWRHASNLATRINWNNYVFNTRESNGGESVVSWRSGGSGKKVSRIRRIGRDCYIVSLCVFRKTEPRVLRLTRRRRRWRAIRVDRGRLRTRRKVTTWT